MVNDELYSQNASSYNDIMRAVQVHLTAEELARRRATGIDRWDEMWEGVLHMTPAPSVEHQRLLDRLIGFLEPALRNSGSGQLVSGINVFRSSTDYRIPDLTFIAAGHEQRVEHDGVRGGGPDAVIEIRSPEDETYDKVPFYAALGVTEVVVIDRDTKRPALFRLAGAQYVAVQADPEGWLKSETMLIRLRVVDSSSPRLRVEHDAESKTHIEI
jgi:Uma2 family endonuclease